MLAAQSMASSLRTGKAVKHIAMLSFATLWTILRSVFAASCVDCVEKLSQKSCMTSSTHCAEWSMHLQGLQGRDFWQPKLQAHPSIKDFWFLCHSVCSYFNKPHSKVFQRCWEWVKGKTLLREWKNPIACALSIDSWRWEGALSGIPRGCQSHVIHVGSFSLFQSSGTFLPP